MTPFLILGAIVAVIAPLVIRRLVRVKRVRERADALCGVIHVQRRTRRSLGKFLQVLDLTSKARTIQLYLALGAAATAVVSVSSGPVAGASTAVLFVAAYFYVAKRKLRQRERTFVEHLPLFLERIRRLVMIGNTLQNSFIEAASSAEPIISEHFEPVLTRVRHGAALADALGELAHDRPTPELHMLAAYVRSNTKFGGRVANTLLNLINQMGNKQRLEREIKAATAEPRASALMLVGLMIFMIVLLSLNNPQHVQFYFNSSLGRAILGGILVWPTIGLLIMKRILRLDF